MIVISDLKGKEQPDLRQDYNLDQNSELVKFKNQRVLLWIYSKPGAMRKTVGLSHKPGGRK